jgi:hypothetical protein
MKIGPHIKLRKKAVKNAMKVLTVIYLKILSAEYSLLSE